MRDFSIQKYAKLCQSIAKKYKAITFTEYVENDKAHNFIILRHDIDRLPGCALAMAKIEHKYGLKSSYYFRVPGTFSPEIIREIAQLGHEIGYHYENLDQAKGDYTLAINIFEKSLKKLRLIYPVKTICMHGNPLTHFDNRDLWQKFDFRKYGIIGETYLSLAADVAYFSDTGRNWSQRYKGKDHPVHADGRFDKVKLEYTDDVIRLIESKKIDKICLVVHSERWNSTYFGWLAYSILDRMVQIAKDILKA